VLESPTASGPKGRGPSGHQEDLEAEGRKATSRKVVIPLIVTIRNPRRRKGRSTAKPETGGDCLPRKGLGHIKRFTVTLSR